MSIITFIIGLIKSLFSKLFKKKVKTEPAVTEEVEVVVKPSNTAPAPCPEPDVTNPDGQITSLLWKPVSDTNPKVVVIVVSCDEIRSDDLRVEVYTKTGGLMRSLKNCKTSPGRGNQLPGDKFGRINFKVGPTFEEFKRYAPVSLKFFVNVGKTKKYLKIQGLDEVKVRAVGKRWNLKHGKMVEEKK